MAAKDWAGVAAGLALAGFGLGAFVASSGNPAPVPGADPAFVPESVVETVVVTAPVPEIPGLPDATVRVLAEHGYAGVPSADDLGLSPAVIRVLENDGSVLLVPGSEGP